MSSMKPSVTGLRGLIAAGALMASSGLVHAAFPAYSLDYAVVEPGSTSVSTPSSSASYSIDDTLVTVGLESAAQSSGSYSVTPVFDDAPIQNAASGWTLYE